MAVVAASCERGVCVIWLLWLVCLLEPARARCLLAASESQLSVGASESSCLLAASESQLSVGGQSGLGLVCGLCG